MAFFFLQGFRHLQTLSLRGNMIGDEGCMNLCRALEECEALQEMDLSENALTDVGAVHLGALLLQRGNIHSLILRSKAQVLQGHPRRTLHPMQSVGRVVGLLFSTLFLLILSSSQMRTSLGLGAFRSPRRFTIFMW